MPSGADVTVCKHQLALQGVILAVPKLYQIQKHPTEKKKKNMFRNVELCSGNNTSAAKEGRERFQNKSSRK